MKLGIFVWDERRNTFRESPVIEGRSAMLWKLGGSPLSERVIGKTRCHELHSVAAIWRPRNALPSRGCASAGSCAADKAAVATHENSLQCMLFNRVQCRASKL